MNLTREFFFDLERRLIDAGLDSDEKSFAEIKSILQNPKKLSADEFASATIYVILASGFSQKTAKKKHAEIMSYLHSVQSCPLVGRDGNLGGAGIARPKVSGGGGIKESQLLKLFNNKNKINAIVRVWQNRAEYRDNYYLLNDLESKLFYLQKLPHIGKITVNHLARNLGENVFKRDVWIERLLSEYGEDCLEKLALETNLPIGYVDVVLWKGLQNGFIKL
jgi:hypothetical protein